MPEFNILLVDDEEENLSSTKELLCRWGYDVDTVSRGDDAIDLFRTNAKDYAVVVLDYRMPEKTGAETAAAIRELNEEVMLLMYSAFPSVESLTATIRAGGLNFVDKNEDILALKEALAKACLEYEKVRRARPAPSHDEAVKLINSIGMVGRSQKLARVAERVTKFRTSRKPVLILGETGVGKEMIARALHEGTTERFFVVNCAAFQGSTLVEAELFGHEKGSFTGATTRKVGILEAARGGTVYLDEIQHLELQIQGKLLRALREMKIRRVGGLLEESVNFRLVASCWPDIEERVAKGTFLPDLYYRLKFLSVEIPPLRERPEDIEPLIVHFTKKHQKETGERKSFLQKALRQLEKYAWPGNVGELDGVVAALLMESNRPTIGEADLGGKFGGGIVSSLTLAQLEAKQERERRDLVANTISTSKSDRQAAERLGLAPSSLHWLKGKLGLGEARS